MIQQKDWLSQRILEESGKYDVEALQGERNRRSSEPIQQMTEQHIPQNEEDVGIGKKNLELLINYDNIGTVERQEIVGKIVELMKKYNLPIPYNLKKNYRVRLKEKTNLWMKL